MPPWRVSTSRFFLSRCSGASACSLLHAGETRTEWKTKRNEKNPETHEKRTMHEMSRKFLRSFSALSPCTTTQVNDSREDSWGTLVEDFKKILNCSPCWQATIRNTKYINSKVGHPSGESKSLVFSPRWVVAQGSSSCRFLWGISLFRAVPLHGLPLCRGICNAQVGQHDVQLDLYNLSALPAVSRSAYHLIKRQSSTLATHISRSGCGERFRP